MMLRPGSLCPKFMLFWGLFSEIFKSKLYKCIIFMLLQPNIRDFAYMASANRSCKQLPNWTRDNKSYEPIRNTLLPCLKDSVLLSQTDEGLQPSFPCAWQTGPDSEAPWCMPVDTVTPSLGSLLSSSHESKQITLSQAWKLQQFGPFDMSELLQDVISMFLR